MRTSLAPLFFVGELFLLLLVRGEGKYEGAGAPYCAPGLTTHCALRTRAFPSVALSMHPLPQRDAYPSGCDGNRTRYGLLAKPWPVDLRPHPTILFCLGNRRPSGGRTDALCWSSASGSRGARPEPPRQSERGYYFFPFLALSSSAARAALKGPPPACEAARSTASAC